MPFVTSVYSDPVVLRAGHTSSPVAGPTSVSSTEPAKRGGNEVGGALARKEPPDVTWLEPNDDFKNRVKIPFPEVVAWIKEMQNGQFAFSWADPVTGALKPVKREKVIAAFGKLSENIQEQSDPDEVNKSSKFVAAMVRFLANKIPDEHRDAFDTIDNPTAGTDAIKAAATSLLGSATEFYSIRFRGVN